MEYVAYDLDDDRTSDVEDAEAAEKYDLDRKTVAGNTAAEVNRVLESLNKVKRPYHDVDGIFDLVSVAVYSSHCLRYENKKVAQSLR